MPLGVSSCDSEDVLLTLNFSFIVCGPLPRFSIHLLISCAAIFFGSWENLPRKLHRPYRVSSWKRAGGAGFSVGAGTRLVGVKGRASAGA